MRGVDISSDHYLLGTVVRLRFKRYNIYKRARKKRFNMAAQEQEAQTAFKISLSNQFQSPQDLIENIETEFETHWEQCMKLWLNTCEEVLGKTTQHKEWISSHTIKRIEKRKEKKATLRISRTITAKVKAHQ
jgi:hypothetical protein